MVSLIFVYGEKDLPTTYEMQCIVFLASILCMGFLVVFGGHAE